ncbi:FAD-dependent oxidoreductase [Legionella anisa]|uniref:Pyridine nucleotide-disulfide oxidoreductase n=1 Tax=Legionella anisa TaxID=28082 RepID=A0AAX0WUG2_9GAMM|nr:FAD-dependent oxidoreductase [Legionella anisa]AWN74155.1 pyridine nucleotide-disulfide oxidoreductase [Legionella anisa]KTC71438.1 Pyridine nucleotide-disulfide oxidoreductase [Legionella anisa]MBN5935181.1 FAD-dependent oxidoreductase [Legionella anisa]MCW8425817.1 FAD-dependent oxidoreductase [Legionella anisa]MCW8448752.1 FAD-dependent oxidoreductase [Legionella anisa]
MHKKIYQWAVIGAGPAGIAAVGKLLDNGLLPEDILWLDPHFKVGDFGLYWRNVSSNTKVKYFKDFLSAVHSFHYQEAPIDFQLNHLPLDETCTLSFMAEPLQWITENFLQKVQAVKTTIHNMFLSKRLWSLSSDSQTYHAKNVILATGALPSSLNYPGVNVIPFDTAIDKEKLSAVIHHDETYGVFGSSHSAIIILKHLVELNVKKIINFYRSPCCYAIEMDDWILFDNTGLKGQSAAWAREHIDGVLPSNLVRYNVSEPNIARFLPECSQVIYAVGFEQRKTIVIGDYENSRHNPYVGIIGPGLFGLGIAYPETKADAYGNVESQVGLWKFMVYLNKVMPLWLKYTT